MAKTQQKKKQQVSAAARKKQQGAAASKKQGTAPRKTSKPAKRSIAPTFADLKDTNADVYAAHQCSALYKNGSAAYKACKTGPQGAAFRATFNRKTQRPTTRGPAVTTPRPVSTAASCLGQFLGQPVSSLQSYVGASLAPGYKVRLYAKPMKIAQRVGAKDIFVEQSGGVITRIVCGAPTVLRNVPEQTVAPSTTGYDITGNWSGSPSGPVNVVVTPGRGTFVDASNRPSFAITGPVGNVYTFAFTDDATMSVRALSPDVLQFPNNTQWFRVRETVRTAPPAPPAPTPAFSTSAPIGMARLPEVVTATQSANNSNVVNITVKDSSTGRQRTIQRPVFREEGQDPFYYDLNNSRVPVWTAPQASAIVGGGPVMYQPQQPQTISAPSQVYSPVYNAATATEGGHNISNSGNSTWQDNSNRQQLNMNIPPVSGDAASIFGSTVTPPTAMPLQALQALANNTPAPVVAVATSEPVVAGETDMPSQPGRSWKFWLLIGLAAASVVAAVALGVVMMRKKKDGADWEADKAWAGGPDDMGTGDDADFGDDFLEQPVAAPARRR